MTKHSVQPTGQTASTILKLFRAVAEAFRAILNPNWYGSPEYLKELEDEAKAEQAIEVLLRERYASAMTNTAELEARAAVHGVRFFPMTEQHQRAAILDFLDNPQSPSLLTPIHATHFQALDQDGNVTFTMAHPVNRAQYMITQRYAARHGWQDEYYTGERATWTTEQWLEQEQRERSNRTLRATAGEVRILSQRDFRRSASQSSMTHRRFG